MRTFLILLAGCGALLAPAASAVAAGATGCEGFLWPLATELTWMKTATAENVASGATLASLPGDKAIELALVPVGEVSFPAKPTSTPKPEDARTFGGFVNVGSLPTGHYQVTLSAHAWIDVIQGGKPLEATGHTGSKDCDGIRKSVRFEVGPGPFVIQVSGSAKDSIRIAVRPAAD